MKSAATNDRTDYILYDILGTGARSHPLARLEYSQDRGQSWTEFTDVKSINYGGSNTNKQYSKFILIPPANTAGAEFNNSQSKFSPGAGGTFDGILARNLYIRPSFGYEMDEASIVQVAHAVGNYSDLWHTQVTGGKIKNDITSEASRPDYKGITDSGVFTFYDDDDYDSGTYSAEGIWVSTIRDFPDTTDTLGLTDLQMDSDSGDIDVYYRASDIQTNISNNTIPFISLGTLAAGTNNFTLPGVKNKYFQFAIVFRTGTWGVGEVDNIYISYDTRYELFSQGEFLVDQVGFRAAFGNYSASIQARDKFKKAYETKVTTPSYTSATDVSEILRDAADRAGIPHDDGSELIADTGYTVIIADDDNFKDTRAADIFDECMVYLNWKNSNYRLELNSDGYLQLVLKSSSVNNADWLADNRYNLINISKDQLSDKLLQRITVLAKDHNTETETQLATQTYTSTQDDTDLTWGNEAIYKRVDVTVNSGDGVFTLNSVENTGINFDITGTTINVTVTVYGAELQSTPPAAGESIFYNNAEGYEGITYKLLNRLVQSDTEARDMAASLTSIYGDPEFKVNCSMPFNPLLELGDRILVWEKYTYSKTIYRVDSIDLTFNAENASMYMSLGLTDLGSDLDNYVWDRDAFTTGNDKIGDDDLKWDSGLLWDYDLDFTVTEDTTNYDFLRPIKAA